MMTDSIPITTNSLASCSRTLLVLVYDRLWLIGACESGVESVATTTPQQDAVNVVARSKVRDNPETTVGLLTMAE